MTVLSGGELPEQLELPPGVELVPLPPLGCADGGLVSAMTGRSVESRATCARAPSCSTRSAALRPEVLVVELFPFGRKKFAGELVPLLDAAPAWPGALVVCSLRDILVARPSDQAAHDERASLTANALFDAILVHADPGFARLEESFRPRDAAARAGPLHRLRRPLRHRCRRRRRRTGAASWSRRAAAASAAPLLRAAARRPRQLATGVPMRLVAGPFLPDADWRRSCRRTTRRRASSSCGAVPDLAAELVRARASVSQCGYNTALDLLRARVPALVVPFAAAGEDEQTRRAARLDGAARCACSTERRSIRSRSARP